MQVKQLHDGQQVQIKGTKPYYQDASVFTLRGFYAKNPQFEVPADWDAECKRQSQIGGFEIGFILSGSMLTSDRAYNLTKQAEREASVHLQTGDYVEIEGRIFRITDAPNNNFAVTEIKSIPVTMTVL